MFKLKTNSRKWLSLLLVLALVNTYVLSAVSGVSASPGYIINVDDSILVNSSTRTATQNGTVNFNAWTNVNPSSLNGVGQSSPYDQVQWTQNVMSEYKDNIQFSPSTFDFSLQPVVVEFKYKIKLNSYTTATKPTTKIWVNFSDGLIDPVFAGDTVSPSASTENVWQTVKLVVDGASQKVYRNFNGSDFIATSFKKTATSFGNLRIYPVALPSGTGNVDGQTPLESPVTWTFDYIKVYTAPLAEIMPSDNINYIVKLTNQMSYDTHTFDTTQQGTLHFRRATATLSGSEPVGSLYDKLKLEMTTMSDWKDVFWLEGANYDTSKYTVIDMKFKVNLGDYTLAAKPSVGLRLYNAAPLVSPRPDSAFQMEAMQKFVPTEADKDLWYTARFVVDPATGKSYASFNGAAYTVANMTVPAESVYQGEFRIYPIAIPGGAARVDGATALETPVTWYIDSFTTYQGIGEIPAPSGGSVEPSSSPSLQPVPNMVELTDKINYDFYNFDMRQTGVLHYRNVSSTISPVVPNGSFYDQIKIVMSKMSDWHNLFYLDAADYSSAKKTVIDLKFKVQLDDYTLSAKPSVNMRLYNNKNAFNMNATTNFIPSEADKDKLHTVRFVIDPDTMKTYASFNGAAYTSSSMIGTTAANYEGEIRIYPVAIPAAGTRTDGTTPLETPVTWYLDSFTACQYTGNIPAPNEAPVQSATEPTPKPTMPVEPTPSPLPPDLAAKIVKTYPDGKMKAFILSFDDGADWCKASDQRAIDILNTYGLKAGFNLVPGVSSQTFRDGIATMYAGHEVVSHTLTHPYLDTVTDAQFLTEIRESKRILEAATGHEVPGLVYPYGYTATTDRIITIFNEGYRYSRAALDSGSFVLPDSFYNWRPTFHFNGTTNIANWQTNFNSLDASTEMKLMFAWGHAWEFSQDVNAGRPTETWNVLEAMCQYLSNNKDKIWNPTLIELVDYVKASRMLEIKYNTEGNIEIKNPSTKVDSWVKVSGVNTFIPKNSTVVVGEEESIPDADFVPSSYLVNIDDNFGYTPVVGGNKTLSEVGSVSYRWDNTSVITPLNQTGSTYKQLDLKQIVKNEYIGHFQVSNPSSFATDKPLVIDVKYKVKLDSYTGNLPKAEFSLQIQSLGLFSGTPTVSSGKFTPSAKDQDVYRTIRFIVDKKTNKIYCSNNGEAYTSFNATAFPSTISDIRIYPKAFPFNNPSDGDQSAELETPITWTFDSFKVYQVEDANKIQLSAFSVKADTANLNLVNFIARAKNFDTTSNNFVLTVALYDTSGATPKLVSVKTQSCSNIGFDETGEKSGSFDVTGLSNYTVKAMVLSSFTQLMPYDRETVTKSQIN